MPERIEIKLVATTQIPRWPRQPRRMWNWSINFGGQKHDDAGKPALEADIALRDADRKLNQLLRDEETDRMAKRKAERKAKQLADYRIPAVG
jgi:hypothetical protein